VRAGSCSETAPPPASGPYSVEAVNEGALAAAQDVARDLLGPDLDATLAGSSEASRCQSSVLAAARRCQNARFDQFRSCRSRQGSGTLADDPRRCFPEGLEAPGACGAESGPLRSAIEEACSAESLDLRAAFPGCGTDDPDGLAACVAWSLECRQCRALDRLHGYFGQCYTCPD